MIKVILSYLNEKKLVYYFYKIKIFVIIYVSILVCLNKCKSIIFEDMLFYYYNK